MAFEEITRRGLVLLGCGKMGSAMLGGWLGRGLPPESVWILDPNPSDWLKSIDGLHLNEGLPESPGLVIVAVKPQMMGAALPGLQALGNSDTVFLTVAAGVGLASYADVLGARTPVIRAMPNTPAAIGRGITAIIGNDVAGAESLDLAEGLLSAVGQVVRLDNESQMDAVTAVSGSGPAYVFHMIEALTEAGISQGLSPDLALHLAKATVGGAGQLAEDSDESPEQLRINVTSPAGTTAAGLEVLMDTTSGLRPLVRQTVAAAAERSRELGK